MDDTVLDIDQIENLIKFCPTKEEMELLKVLTCLFYFGYLLCGNVSFFLVIIIHLFTRDLNLGCY